MRNQEEHRLQVSICKWLDLIEEFPFFAIPNGGQRSLLVGIKLKMEGVKSGVADMFWMISNEKWKGLFVEVKIKKGVQSPNQKEFQKIALQHNYYYAIVRSIEDCQELLNKYRLNQI